MNKPHPVLAVFRATHSHVFPGSRVTGVQVDGPALTPRPVQFRFGDETSVRAEIVVDSAGRESYAVQVPSYLTAAGHPIPAALWPVVNLNWYPVTSELVLKLGRRLLLSATTDT